jgi:hypothetical protein
LRRLVLRRVGDGEIPNERDWGEAAQFDNFEAFERRV